MLAATVITNGDEKRLEIAPVSIIKCRFCRLLALCQLWLVKEEMRVFARVYTAEESAGG